MTLPGIEPLSPGPLANTLPIRPMGWYIYAPIGLCSQMALVESYQRIKKGYLFHPCLTLSIIRCGAIQKKELRPPQQLDVVVIGKGAFGSPSTTITNSTYLYITGCQLIQFRVRPTPTLFLSANTYNRCTERWFLKLARERHFGHCRSLFPTRISGGPGDLGSIPGRVIPKTLKMELDTTLLNTQHYKVRFKGKVEQSREWSSALPYTLVS